MPIPPDAHDPGADRGPEAGQGRDLLFALLALEMGLVGREVVADAVRDWREGSGDGSLEGLIAGRAGLSPEARDAIESRLALHLRLHDDDPARSVATLPASTLAAARARPAGPVAAPAAESASDDRAGPLEDWVDATVTFAATGEDEATSSGRNSPIKEAPPPANAPPVAGRFRPIRPHARGGLGRIFVAIDEELGREVALKEILPEHADDPVSRARFLIEAEVTGAMEHPGLVPVYGQGKHPDGRPFYAMRLIRGESLKQAIERLHASRDADPRPEPIARALRPLVRRLIDVCNAVAYAHNRGVIHRDLKPANIMLGPYGETLVVDWGLAKPIARGADPAAPLGPPDARPAPHEHPLAPGSGSGHAETMPGRAVGTPAYMSPEQAAGRLDLLGPASDVYSLGATLYHLLTGRTPFGESDVMNVLIAVQRGQFMAPRSLRPGVPPALQAICLKAMSRESADRYPSARALADDLERWLADEPVSAWREPIAARLARWSRRHKALALALAAAMLGGLAVATFAAVRLGRMAAVERAERVDGLRVAAKFAARTVAVEIDRRWRILEAEADDPELAALLEGASAEPPDSPRRRALQAWIAARRDEHHGAAAATNWFACDAAGVQVARSPFNSTSVGTNYAFRDYFHGLGRDLPEDTRDTAPITRPHRSIVFRSQATNAPMVTFSVPVWSGHPGEAGRRVVGVIGMSVDLGRFGVLQLDLGDDQVAVLVDLRDDAEGQPGLILHHPRLAAMPRGEVPALHLTPGRVARLDALRASALSRKRRRDRDPFAGLELARRTPQPGSFDPEYLDPAGGAYAGQWLAAFEPVVVEGRPAPIDDTGWVVIVQERATPDG